MVYRAERKNEKLKFIITKEGMKFEGVFLYTKQSEENVDLLTQYVSSPIKDEDEWKVANRLLLAANSYLDSVRTSKKGLTDICWQKFFNSKQPGLI
ncbi:MAG: hypothetical protein MJ181_01915 [Treponema sp.]|uniref:hypothetical protein n=1 Tax=Treponema sp. TaxID=166 RepID=UPI00298EBFE8|nr:hypothetical protein [Treponema sp.]MCQ2596579.1 hypothetical protein [Treponema sp.]MCQ2601606.1 hypothetical protein [Treponema sp.]